MRNLKQQLEIFNSRGKLLDWKGYTDEGCNFFDWSCDDSALKNKAIKLFKKVNKIANSDKFDLEQTYCYFKNNDLYDQINICDLSGNVIYTVIPSVKINGVNRSIVFHGQENDFDSALIEGTWKDVVNFFNK